MATTVEVNAIADAIIAAFGKDAAALTALTAFLRRSKLETDLALIDSSLRKARATAATNAAATEAALQQLETQRNAKLAEIDAL